MTTLAKHFAATPGKIPSGNQAGVYASTLAYLNAVAATGSDDAKIVVPQMKTFKGEDTRQLRERHDGISGQKCL